jgi:predicted nucleotidyltransferase
MEISVILEEANKVVKLLQKLKEVKAITLFGSLARGYVDEFTHDFDMVAFAREIPEESKRKDVLNKVVKNWRFYNTRLIQDAFDLNSLTGCTIHWVKIKDAEEWINDFKEGLKPYPRLVPHPWLIDFVIYGKILHDPLKLIEKWKEEFKEYPEWLKRNECSLLNEIFRFTRSKFIERELKRNNLIFLENKFSQVKNMIIRVVYALNEVYWCMTAEKWFFKEAKSFKLLPENFIERMEGLSKLSILEWEKKRDIIDELANEIFEQVKKILPDLKIRNEW